MRLSDIVKHITSLFEKKRKNPIQLETDSNLESNLKFLKVSDKSTPMQISEDTVNVEGSLTVNGSAVQTGTDAAPDTVTYYYDTKITNYYASATSVFIPLAGYIAEMSGASGAVITGQGEYVSFHAPYNGTLERLMFRSEVAQNGTLQVDLYESADNTETPATEIGTMDTSINIADDTSVEVNFSSMTSGTNAIVKGRVYAVKITSPSASQDTFVTTAWKWDITS